MSETAKINLLDFNRAALEAYFVANDEKPFRARQLMQWVHQRGVTDFALMTDMSKNLREFLSMQCCIEMPRILDRQRLADSLARMSSAGRLLVKSLARPSAQSHIALVVNGRSGRRSPWTGTIRSFPAR